MIDRAVSVDSRNARAHQRHPPDWGFYTNPRIELPNQHSTLSTTAAAMSSNTGSTT